MFSKKLIVNFGRELENITYGDVFTAAFRFVLYWSKNSIKKFKQYQNLSEKRKVAISQGLCFEMKKLS